MAKRAKKIKYKIGITTYNTEFKVIDVSKKTFDQLLNRYKEEMNENHKQFAKNEEYWFDISTRTNEHTQFMEYITEVEDGPTFVTFMKLECKDGFSWR